jgi:hypothetical protein
MAASQKQPAAKKAAPSAAAEPKKRAARLQQADVPAYSLPDALRVAEALRDDFANKSAAPLDLAKSLELSPNSSGFRMLTSAATAYGLTEGAAQSTLITLNDLGRRAVAPTEEGDDARAMREAVLKPRVIREFLEKYNGNLMPQKTIAMNVIETMNVPKDATERAYDMIIRNAEALGLLMDIKGKKYVKLDAPPQALKDAGQGDQRTEPDEYEAPPPDVQADGGGSSYAVAEAPVIPPKPPTDPVTNNRVFITHGKNQQVVEQIKKILAYGKFEPIVSAQLQTVAKPVPDKVMDDMRSCSAAIVHVGIEKVLMDEKGDQHPQINSNVLIEIGAAMALYPKRYVLLVEKGVTLPSNLQGLHEVRYEGEQLEFDATMKLLEVFSSF